MGILVIDGSLGEGGGQILRTSLSMSMLTGERFRIERIRAGRPKPGLLRQHLTAVRAASEICDANVRGDELGSRQVTFEPRAVRAGDYRFSIGTAGSTMLVLQTVLPALLTAKGSSTILLEGGTHNIAAPPFEFFERTFVPLINRMGPRVAANLDRHGFFPAGGGRIRVEIEPSEHLQPLELASRGEIRRQSCLVYLADLPRRIADREWDRVASRLKWPAEALELQELPPGRGPGNVLSLIVESEMLTEVFTAFGRKEVSSESVADEAIDEAREYLLADVPVGKHLADQLLLPLVIAGRGLFRTLPLTPHSVTNIDVLRKFARLPIVVSEEAGICSVSIGNESRVETSGESDT